MKGVSFLHSAVVFTSSPAQPDCIIATKKTHPRTSIRPHIWWLLAVSSHSVIPMETLFGLQALPTIAFSACLFSKFRQHPRMGHLLESTQSRFTLLPEQGTRRGRSSWAVSSQCVVGGPSRDWPDRKATRADGTSSSDYERRFRAPERLFSMDTSQIQKGNRAHPMWKADIYSLVPGKALRGDQRSIQACRGCFTL